MGGKERPDGVGIFIAEKLVDNVLSVKRHNERVLILKMFLYTTIITAAILRPFVRDFPGELVPEENIHPLTPILIINHPLSASSIYYDP